MKYSKIDLIKEAIKNKGFIKKIPDIFRMIKLWMKGEYKTKFMSLFLPLLGIVYVISPIDLIPEITIPVIGVLDDLALLTFIIPKFIKEVDQFLLWEAQRNNANIIDVEIVE